MGRALALLALTSSACSLTGFVCASSGDCGAGAACIDDRCAASDTTCPSGFRWDDSAGSRASECAGAAQPDAAGDMTPTLACGTTGFCEDFETDDLASTWYVTTTNTTASIDASDTSVPAHHGTHAYHIVTNALTTGSSLDTVASLTQRNGTFFVGHSDFWTRTWIYVKGPRPDGSDFNPLVFVQQADQPYTELQVAFDGSGNLELNDGLDGQSKTSTTPFPTDQWACIEHHVVVSDSGPVELYLNGTLVGSLAATTVAAPSFGSYAMYWGSEATTSDSSSHDIWYDDVVLSFTRAGCGFEPS